MWNQLQKMKKPTPLEILKRTASYFGLEDKQMTQARRGKWEIAWPRSLAMSIAYEQPYTGKEVSKVFNRHRTAVIYAHERVENLCRLDPELSKTRDKVRIAILA